VPRLTRLPWIPAEQEWLAFLEAARSEPPRNRVMLALAYDAALRREELCSLRTDDIDPAHRTLRVRAETTKNRLECVVPYSAATGVLLSQYLAHRASVSRARGPLFLSESRRSHAQPLSLWTWSKVVRRIALASGVERFSRHDMAKLKGSDAEKILEKAGGVFGDKGFIGTDYITTPIRKPECRDLLQWEHEWNNQVSSLRAPVERAVATLKTWRILFTDYRRPLRTFKSSFRAVIGLYFFKESFA
jgi:site-specific recombinase XerC